MPQNDPTINVIFKDRANERQWQQTLHCVPRIGEVVMMSDAPKGHIHEVKCVTHKVSCGYQEVVVDLHLVSETAEWSDI